jgi:hypothetical protein
MGELASKCRSQVGEYPVELFRILDADGPGRKVANAFLKGGEGHGASTMPQCATRFDTVRTVDPPNGSSSREMHCDVDFGESGAPPRPVKSSPAGCLTVLSLMHHLQLWRGGALFCLGGARFVAVGLVVRGAVRNACFRNPAKASWSCSTGGDAGPHATRIIPIVTIRTFALPVSRCGTASLSLSETIV